MIALSMQIKAIIFSLIYGVFISFMVNVNYKCLFNKNMIFKIIFDSIFILDLGMLYFFILQFINFGYLHVYFFLALSVGRDKYVLEHTRGNYCIMTARWSVV